MERRTVKRPPPVYGRARRGRRQSDRPDYSVIRLMAIALILVFALSIRLAKQGVLFEMKNYLAASLRTDVDYKGAMATLGEAISGERAGNENALLVFGRKMLGLDTGQPQDAESENQAGDRSQPAENVFNEISPEDTEDIGAGGSSGLSFEGAGFPVESQLPDIMPIGFGGFATEYDIPLEELEDGTEDLPFAIPTPDAVDTTAYEMNFAHKSPLGGRLTSGFGYRVHPISGNTTFHYGADVAASTGTRVNAFAAGTVSQTGYSAVYGNYIKIEHPDGFLSFYAHLNKIHVKQGEKVTLGQKIGTVGETGYATGPHLHFEIRRNGMILDPFLYVAF